MRKQTFIGLKSRCLGIENSAIAEKFVFAFCKFPDLTIPTKDFAFPFFEIRQCITNIWITTSIWIIWIDRHQQTQGLTSLSKLNF